MAYLLAPAGWLWCVIQILTGSWIAATLAAPIISFLALDALAYSIKARSTSAPRATAEPDHDPRCAEAENYPTMPPIVRE
jgi:hypothetical protein